MVFAWEFVDFVTSCKDILASKTHCSSWDICIHVETRYFLIFQNIVGTAKNFQNVGTLLSTIFYKVSGILNETLTLTSLAYIFSKNSLFLFLDKSQIQKSANVITCFFCTVRKQKFRSVHTTIQNPPPHSFQCYLSLSVWCVCVFCLFTPFLSVLFVFHRKNFVLLHLMNRYETSTSD